MSRIRNRATTVASLAIFSTFVLGLAAPPARSAPPTIYVSPAGKDQAAGTKQAPLRTIGAALSRAAAGATVSVSSGSYPAIRDQSRRTARVTVRGTGPTLPTVGGLHIFGGQHLAFSGLRLSGGVMISDHPVGHQRQPATDITIRNSELTTANTAVCVFVRTGSTAVTLQNNYIHDCQTGIGGPGGTAPSSDIRIVGNVLERFSSDAIQFGQWSNVLIQGNAIRSMRDPAGVIHNDGIQFTGGSQHVKIADNEISGSQGQLLFIQDAFGPIDDVLVQNNLIVGSKAYAIQTQGATNTRFISNTVWDSGFGGLLIRRGQRVLPGGARSTPVDTVVANNILAGLDIIEGAQASVSVGNTVGRCRRVPLPGTACVPNPGFMNPSVGNFSLAPMSPVRGTADPAYAPAFDKQGRRRGTTPTPGALS